MHREMGQPSLVEGLLPKKPGQNHRLGRVHQAVDRVRIGKLAAQVYDTPEGRPSYPLDVLGCGLGTAETGACSAAQAGEAEAQTQSGSGCWAGGSPRGGLSGDPFGVPG